MNHEQPDAAEPQRRERMDAILAAACRVIARDGCERLRMTDVAREAGVSSALVHYYFATRADLLARAFAYADEQVDLRAAAESRPGDAPLDELWRLLTAYAADEAVVHESWMLWSEMWRYALHHPELRAVVGESYRGWVDQVSDLLLAAQADGSLAAGVDVRAAAARLTALIDGLGQQVLLGMLDRGRMRELITGALQVELAAAIELEARP